MKNIYDASICKNGHIISCTGSVEQNFCSECGGKIYSTCDRCGSPIPGVPYDYQFSYHIYEHPNYCDECGAAYPWTQTAIDLASQILEEANELAELERKNLGELLPDLIVETPKTNLAIIRIKKVLAKAGDFTADALKQFIIDFGCELAKRSIGL
ncbi:MAG: DUF2321 domain-containing protein [Firmicutes bacterium]|jgi:hypothetical protein|nr:DUF2321 domain-containing protein [Bacillota bacterium]